MLHAIAPDLWHLQRRFSSYGLPMTSRMTVVRLGSGALWLHSPVALNDAVNETVWFHKASRTLILTDLCQWWQGELGVGGSAMAMLAGVRRQLAVSRTLRILVKDRAAVRASADRILQWPFERVIVAHNVILEDGAHAAVARALQYFS